MKKCILLLLILPFYLKAQSKVNIKEIDTISIVFKAKLFTLSNHGLEDKNVLINNIEKMPCAIFGNNEFLFFKISGRRYCQENTDLFTVNWCDCDYYISYSINKKVYYFLGGFEIDNIDQFAKEYEGSLFQANWDYKIDDETLSNFIYYMAGGQTKKAKKCFVKCPETWD